MDITILTDDRSGQRGLLAEHGLSLWIEDGEDKVLFDTGQSSVYLHNAALLEIDVAQANAVVISHGHYDHGGGLVFFPEQARWPRVLVHPDAFLPRYSHSPAPGVAPRSIGLPWKIQELGLLDHRLVTNESVVQLGENLFCCTAIPRRSGFEPVSSTLSMHFGGIRHVDDGHDEQLLVVRTPKGLVVIVGCSHPGIVNCLLYIRSLFPSDPIQMVLGGMHLEGASLECIDETAESFLRMEIQKVVPLHCTGDSAICRFESVLGPRLLRARTGDRITP